MDVKKGLNYKFEPQKYMFGMCEEFEGSLDKGANADTTVDLIDTLGAKSMRIWMHHKRLIKRIDNSDKLIFKEDVFLRYRGYVENLAKRGIRILAMNHNYIFPASFTGNIDSVAEIAERGTKAYLDQMKLITTAYEMMASAFPEIIYWECGNETNMNSYLCKSNATSSPIKNAEYNPEYYYTNLEKAQITADICYYANLGVKKGNSNAFVVFAAPTPYRGYVEMCEFYEFTYKSILSGSFPTGLPADTNADNYFQVQCYHAYNFGGDASIITNGAKMVYNIMKRYGDGGKKVFISEFGYHDSDFIINRGMTKQQADNAQAKFFETDFKAFKSLGFIESVYVFRLYDWLIGPGIEIDFGLFTSPACENPLVPKQKAKTLYKIFNGKDADEKKLYKYANIK